MIVIESTPENPFWDQAKGLLDAGEEGFQWVGVRHKGLFWSKPRLLIELALTVQDSKSRTHVAYLPSARELLDEDAATAEYREAIDGLLTDEPVVWRVMKRKAARERAGKAVGV